MVPIRTHERQALLGNICPGYVREAKAYVPKWDAKLFKHSNYLPDQTAGELRIEGSFNGYLHLQETCDLSAVSHESLRADNR
jgi:hypothetical protein